jgi:hypothetical protein
MRKLGIALCAILAAIAAGLAQQRSAQTRLAVRIEPEARVIPERISLRFQVSPDGLGGVTAQTHTVAAWVRSLPSQQIRLTAALENLAGPAGAVPPTAVHWSGKVERATSGGTEASCTSGKLGNSELPLATGWSRSGALACLVVFSLAEPQSLLPGKYTGVVRLSLRAE